MNKTNFNYLMRESMKKGFVGWLARQQAEQEELNATGVLKDEAWKLEWVDEHGYLVPEALEPGSAFLRMFPHVMRLVRCSLARPRACILFLSVSYARSLGRERERRTEGERERERKREREKREKETKRERER
jgi:hypothetical protein